MGERGRVRMTSIEIIYSLAAPLTAEQSARIGELTGQYGVERIRVDEEQQTIRIRYDASRLKETEVIQRVRESGIPAEKRLRVEAVVT